MAASSICHIISSAAAAAAAAAILYEAELPRHVKGVQSLQQAYFMKKTWGMLCRFLVESARERGLEVIDRCNLTVLLEPGQEHLAQYLAQHQVWSMLFLTTCICSTTCNIVALLFWVAMTLHPHNLQRVQELVELLLCSASCCMYLCRAQRLLWSSWQTTSKALYVPA